MDHAERAVGPSRDPGEERLVAVEDDGRVIVRCPDGTLREFMIPRRKVAQFRRLLAFERFGADE
jgi:hypothetical protein